ncbi:MAG: HTTM domain-containing protein [Sandaracinaceae bacterium]|nr:HTTM domain-containing protein [Sandaracinaceae bacterium]MBP7682005.1 HTTM domain-containing protein [Deltaproteobacteria bacterium]MBK7152813.1 HTTM domain-containing protein [Sandaracinaceae bacterium]MBK7774042.1 HTTM domain-containing protein [Sandaracinaceae bacterium]MBK8412222.1 HTTM domain-containing protein [Sandaracinaceae bacterium]
MSAPSTPSGAFDRYFFGPVDLLRPYLLTRALLALLAFDCWLELVPHGARYGVGGFNVAHFAFLDALLPLPTAPLYVGSVLLAGWLALTMALVGPTRVGMAALTTLYTLAWSSSLLDTYQHHYLLSLLLLAMTCFPSITLRDALGGSLHDDPDDPSARVPHESWGFVSFCVSCAIVYFYTAVTKTNADWRDGHAIARLAGHTDAARSMLAFAAEHDVTPAVFWSGFAKSAIAIQLVIAVGFVLAPVFDRLPRVRARRVLAFWVLAPLSFHAGAAHMDLKIGWFTEYMLLVASIVFLPRELLAGLLYALSAPARALDAWLTAEEPTRALIVASAVVTAAGVLGVFALTDLPGGMGAGVLAAVAAVALVLALGLHVHGHRARALSAALSGLLAGGLLLLALVESDVRFDYYRNAGGDARRLASAEQPQLYLDALEHYTKAKRYYPPAYREFWMDWDRDAAARVARGEAPPDEQRAHASGAPPRNRDRQLAELESTVEDLRSRGLLPPDEGSRP